jgi:phenylacetate-coenzyme A ligase PaaK-like adenylate-forming protein
MKKLLSARPHMAARLVRAYFKSKEEGIPIRPRDIWTPKGLLCAGTDSSCFKKRIESYWGVRPLEIFGGTEPTCIATETWSKDGLVFFPDICFYEFIPEQELYKSLEEPSYQPRTFLMDELVAGEKYELVISNFRGGAFMRYRVGDVFRCISTFNEVDEIAYPQFEYVDRIPTVIDIAGFTRISENTILKTIETSKLDIHNWFAVKRRDFASRPYMQMYVELGEQAILSGVMAKNVIQEHLSVYFRHIDADYHDLKRMLGIDPLVVTVMPTGTIEEYEKTFDRKIRRINPSHYDITGIEKLANIS